MELLDVLGSSTTLRKTGVTNGGEYHGPCPFCGGNNRFMAWPAAGKWWCRGCNRRGDAIDFIREKDGLSFRKACQVLGQDPANHQTSNPKMTAIKTEDEPTADWQERALATVEQCERWLWSDAGARAKDYLQRRCLHDETLRRYRIGYCPFGDDGKPGRETAGLWVPTGIVIPWLIDAKPSQLKVRFQRLLPDGRRYGSVKGGHPSIFGLDQRGGRETAVLTEGEFDGMLLEQEAGDLVDVLTVGSAQKGLDTMAMMALLPYRRILVAYDVDQAGQDGAAKLQALSARIRSIQVSIGKDVTEFAQQGGRLRDWITFELARLEAASHDQAPRQRGAGMIGDLHATTRRSLDPRLGPLAGMSIRDSDRLTEVLNDLSSEPAPLLNLYQALHRPRLAVGGRVIWDLREWLETAEGRDSIRREEIREQLEETARLRVVQLQPAAP